MKLVLHGIFARDYGSSVEINADTIFEAIEAFSRQVGFYTDRFLDARPVARVIGRDTVQSLHEAADEVHLVPAMRGGGGKFSTIIVGAVMIGIGLAIGTTGVGAPIGIAFIVSGATTMAMGVANLFVRAPQLKKVSDPDASLYLAAAGMTTQIGTPIGICVGRVKRSGHALSFDVTSNSLTQATFPTNP